MRKNKLLIALLLAGATCLGIGAFAGCSNNNNNSSDIDDPNVPLAPGAEQTETCEHDHYTPVEAVEVTCETNGNIAYWYCEDCGKYYSDANAKDEITLSDTMVWTDKTNPAHNYGELIKGEAETCEKYGSIAHYHCDICKKDFNEDKEEVADINIAPAGHNYGELIVKVAATCETAGTVAHYHCDDCNGDFDAEYNKLTDIAIAIDANTHKGEHHEYTAPSCTAEGNVEYWACEHGNYDAEGNKIEDVKIEKAAHTSDGNLVIGHEATCETAGKKTYSYCENCGNYVTTDGEVLGATAEEAEANAVVAAHGHTAGTKHEAVDATCTAKGNIEYYECEHCNNYVDEEGNKLSNVETDRIVHKEGETSYDAETGEYTCPCNS